MYICPETNISSVPGTLYKVHARLTIKRLRPTNFRQSRRKSTKVVLATLSLSCYSSATVLRGPG